MTKNILYFCFALILCSSCEEKDLSEKNPALPKENVLVAATFLFNDGNLPKDTILTDGAGNQFFISEIKVLLNNLYFVNFFKDTIRVDGRYLFTREETDNLITRLEPAGYSAYLVADVGMDSLAAVEARTGGGLSESDPLMDIDVKRPIDASGFGYNHLIIKGRIIDVANPLDTNGTIPFSYKIGTDELVKRINSEVVNFRVEAVKPVKFVFVIDVGRALQSKNLKARSEVVTDKSNLADFNAATEVMNLTQFFLF